MVLIKLLDEEQRTFELMFEPTTVASFYVKNATSTENMKEYLTERFSSILKANPWLCGRLVKVKTDDGKTNVCISYSNDVSNPLDYISHITDDTLFENKQWKPIWLNILPHLPKKTGQCIDKDEQLCKLLIIENLARSELALVFSLSHSLGDGSTFYQLWKMLDTCEDVVSMVAERDHNFVHYVQRDTNLSTTDVSSWKFFKFFAGMIGRGLRRIICRKKAPRINMYKVNMDTINRIKAEYHNGGENFVSTNDILNAWFFGKDGCNLDKISMFINLRSRIPELESNMAGTYSLYSQLYIADIDNPTAFRERWKKVLSKDYPQFPDSLTNANGSDNWSSFYHQVEVDGYAHAFHIPVYDVSESSDNVMGIPLCPEGFMIIFNLNCKDIAVYLCAYNDLPDEYFDNSEMLAGKVLS